MGRNKPQETGDERSTWTPDQYEALLKGGEQVTSVLEEMANLVNNYALTMHLKQAQEGNSMPGHFHLDVF